MAVYIAFFPVYRANAVVPLAVGAAYAFDVAAPVAIRYLASEIAISAVVKALQISIKSSNAYYSATAKISNSNFLKFFKGKAALGVASFTAVLAGLGYYANDDVIMKEGGVTIPDGDVSPVKGIGWCDGSDCGATITDAANLICNRNEQYCIKFTIKPYVLDNSRQDLRTVDYYSSDTNVWRSVIVREMPCNYISGDVATCKDNWVAPTGEAVVVDDSIVQSEIISHISSLPVDEQKKLFANDEGLIDSDLSDALIADDVPLMPDNQTSIPNIKDQAWNNAHLITTGKAQSSNPSQSNYVSEVDWDEAYYLANNVANGNDYITGLNSGAISAPDTTGKETHEGGTTTITVDVSGVESRLDTSNTLTQGVIDEIAKINNSTVVLNDAPSDIAKSFWPIKYPDGISGVLTKFINEMKKTPIFKWLNQFVIDVGVGSIPVFDFCFNTIANIDFGCYELSADAYVWSAIKASMILLAVIVSRKIVFGG